MERDLSRLHVSIDIPIDEKEDLTAFCEQKRIKLKDYIYNMIHKDIIAMRKKQLNERLKKSIQQAKDGEIVYRGSFTKYLNEL